MFPAYGYARPLDPTLLSASAEFIDRLMEHYRWIDATYHRGAAVHLFRLEDVYVFNNTIHHIDNDEVFTVYETARANDRPYGAQPDWTATQLRSGAITMSDDDPSLYLGSAGSFNYGHWLIDDLARAQGLSGIRHHTGASRVTIVIPGFGAVMDKVKEDSLRILFRNGTEQQTLCFVPNDRLLYFKTLYYVSPVSYHPALKSPSAVRLLQHHALHRLHALQGRPGARRVYIARSPAYGRAILNDTDVRHIFTKAGFVFVENETLTFGQQVALLRNAEIVAGCMGAALTNTMFCGPGTTVLHLAPEGWMEPFYWDLAATCGHRYAAIYGQRSDATVEPHLSAFSIDPAGLAAMLERLLEADTSRPERCDVSSLPH